VLRPGQRERRFAGPDQMLDDIASDDPGGAYNETLHPGQLTSNKSRINLSALDSLNLNNKLMNFSNNLAVKTLLLEKACDLLAQLGEKHLVIWTSEVQTG